MSRSTYREALFDRLADTSWDILVIGGGITGAGIFREALRHGLRVLLVEQRDFAWGTSSRSSKLVHGGLRYLAQGKLGLTRDSVRERERLADELPGLVDRLGFLVPTYDGDYPGSLAMRAGLTIYDLLALSWSHRHYSSEDFRLLAPRLAVSGLQGGFGFGDAQTDDARLVLRIVREGVRAGGTAVNYARVTGLTHNAAEVDGVELRDETTGETARVRARVVFNATGAWADRLRSEVGGTARLRPLRGSHLVFPSWRFPLAQAVSFCHPIDRRPVFAFPWEGVTLVGTTDVDHDRSLDEEPAIAAAEASYLLAAVRLRFPALDLGPQDVVTTYSGVRPVVGTGKADPSKESREHVIWNEDGLITVTGGKLTTFRLIALDALHAARSVIPGLEQRLAVPRVFDPPPADGLTAPGLSSAQVERLTGRYGTDAPQLVAAAHPGELERIPGTDALWAELRWAARSEAVVHLDDLLLRRVRLGLLLPRAASSTFPRLREICAEELGWTDRQWDEEEQRYTDLWEGCYRLPQLSVTEMDRSTAGLAEGIENDPAARGSA